MASYWDDLQQRIYTRRRFGQLATASAGLVIASKLPVWDDHSATAYALADANDVYYVYTHYHMTGHTQESGTVAAMDAVVAPNATIWAHQHSQVYKTDETVTLGNIMPGEVRSFVYVKVGPFRKDFTGCCDDHDPAVYENMAELEYDGRTGRWISTIRGRNVPPAGFNLPFLAGEATAEGDIIIYHPGGKTSVEHVNAGPFIFNPLKIFDDLLLGLETTVPLTNVIMGYNANREESWENFQTILPKRMYDSFEWRSWLGTDEDPAFIHDILLSPKPVLYYAEATTRAEYAAWARGKGTRGYCHPHYACPHDLDARGKLKWGVSQFLLYDNGYHLIEVYAGRGCSLEVSLKTVDWINACTPKKRRMLAGGDVHNPRQAVSVGVFSGLNNLLWPSSPSRARQVNLFSLGRNFITMNHLQLDFKFDYEIAGGSMGRGTKADWTQGVNCVVPDGYELKLVQFLRNQPPPDETDRVIEYLNYRTSVETFVPVPSVARLELWRDGELIAIGQPVWLD